MSSQGGGVDRVDADPFARLDGAYVLGALEPAERREFEEHLGTCAACQDRVEELRPTVGLLGVARAYGALAEPPPLPDTLLPGLLRRAARERNRRRWFSTSIAVAAVACLVALVVVLWPASSQRATPQALTVVRASPVRATAVVVTEPWGTQIQLHCRYEVEHYKALAASGLDYRLRVIDTSHVPHDAGSWRLVRGGTTDFTGGTSVRRERIASVQVTLPNGTPLLQLTL